MSSIHVKEPVTDEPDDETPVAEPVETSAVTEPSPADDHQETVYPPRTMPRVPLKKLLPFIGVVVAVVLVFLVVSLMNDRRALKQQVTKLSTPQATAVDEADKLKQEVGQLIELPADEAPTVATVQDASKVKSQSFFANSQNGDKVLLFAKAGKAILYRPSTKKIIEVAPINLGNNETTPVATPPATPPASTNHR